MATVDHVFSRHAQISAAFKRLTDLRVMVGIPADKTQRKSGPATNALLGYVHEFGSPKQHIPPRPFLRPGVNAAIPRVRPLLRNAAKAAIDGDEQRMMAAFESAGMVGASAVKKKITDGPFTPLSPVTIARRMAKLQGTKRLSKAQRAAGFTSIRPLIDTGQLRQAITWVIRSRTK